jgi:hypothetical protein
MISRNTMFTVCTIYQCYCQWGGNCFCMEYWFPFVWYHYSFIYDFPKNMKLMNISRLKTIKRKGYFIQIQDLQNSCWEQCDYQHGQQYVVLVGTNQRLILIFVAFLLNMQHWAKTGWHGISIMCQTGATCLFHWASAIKNQY